MIDLPVQNWTVRKPAIRSRGGAVVSQSQIAATVGANILRAGGNAIDAAVAAGFALAAVEPWNSGLGGIGFMTVWLARERRAHVIDFGPVAPARLDPAAYPLTEGTAGDLFSWPSVLEDRNIHGPLSIAVPGEVDGLGLAHARFGRLPWRDLLAPAIELAERGLGIDWYTSLRVALWARELARYPHSASIWLPDGLPPATPAGATLRHLVLPGLARTLRRIAEAGPRDFYEGALARTLAADLKAAGSVVDADDLSRYRARIVEPLEFSYRDTRIVVPGGLTAGPTLAAALARLAAHRLADTPGPAAYCAYAEALSDAYAERFTALGDVRDTKAPGSTSHLNAIDGDGNVVALTQTLLSVFGSKVVLRDTGILMNNGIMWFDPRPGRANSLAPGKRPLSNMCPVIATRDGAGWLAIGGSGGRKILPAVAQILSFLVDFKMPLEAAFHQPRIDASGEPTILVDPRLPDDVQTALAAHFKTKTAELLVLPTNYACPCAVAIEPNGERVAQSDVMSPWSGGAA